MRVVRLHHPTPPHNVIPVHRGTRMNQHPAKIEFCQRVRQNEERYDTANNEEKLLIAREIVEGLYDDGYEFRSIATMDGRQQWVETPRQDAYKKVLDALRDGASARGARR